MPVGKLVDRGGYGGGGNAGSAKSTSNSGGGGGGGMTWFSTSNTFSQGSAILIAGGGGGCGGGGNGYNGGSGGGSSGNSGTGGNISGGGGTQLSGGSAGRNNYGATSGGIGTGGRGAYLSSGYGGGGGGGGYFGGGGGGGNGWGGGGGGSGFIGGDGARMLIEASTTTGDGAAPGNNGSLSIEYLTPTTYPLVGTFVSQVIDTGHRNVSWGNFGWTTAQTENTQIVFKARTSNNSDMSGATDFSSCDPIATVSSANVASSAAMAGNNCVHAGDRYVQYQATLSTSSSLETPEIQDVMVEFNYYSAGTLTSSPFDSASSGNAMARLNWTENLPEGTDVKFQVATSPDNVTYTDFLGPDGTTSSYFTDPSVSSSDMPEVFKQGEDDQYFKYKVYLSTSDGDQTPTLSDVTTYYVVNAPPEFDSTFGTNGVNISQIQDLNDSNWGKVKIDYRIRDIDATTGNQTANFVTPTFEYSTNGGLTWSNINLANVAFAEAPDGGEITDTNLDGNLDNRVLEPILDQEGNETSANYLTYIAYWDAKTQIPEEYSNEFQIRVTINDNEGANNIANAIGNQTILDTKKPEIGTHPVLIDATTSTPTATLDVTDDSTLKMEVNLDNLFGSVLEEDYNDTKEIVLASDPDTIYAKFQDIYGNTTETYFATTPETPNKFMVQDTSNMYLDPPESRLFIAWKTVENPGPGFGSYNVYRSTDQSQWDLLDIIMDRTSNYYADNTVEEDQDYYYRVVTVDQDGNKSYNSISVHGNANGIQDAGEGGGGTITAPPVISNVEESSINTAQAVITWDTNTLSNSTVGYYSGEEGSYEDNIASTSEIKGGLLGKHTVVLTNLDPDTEYFYQISSEDTFGNVGIATGSFRTLPGPKITFGRIYDIYNNQATISWTTDTDANSIVNYSTSIGEDGNLTNPVRIGEDSGDTKNHEQTLTGLVQYTRYYFYLESQNDSGIAIDDNGTNFYSFTTTLDEEPPVISDIDEPMITSSRAAIHWITDEPATSQVEYATSSGGSYDETSEISTMDKGHYVILSGLSPNTKYYYRVISRDISGNSRTSNEESFTTSIDEEFNHDPISDIGSIKVPEKNLSDKNAIVTFTTDQPALCMLELTTSEGNYSNPINAFEDGYDNEANYNKSHAIRLVDLIPDTKYYFKISCHDNIVDDPEEEGPNKFRNWVFSEEENFTTLEKYIPESSVGSGDITAPEISNIKVSSISGESATIAWDTNENANSLVRYGITTEYGNMAGDDLINLDTLKYAKAHQVTIGNLIPGTKYYYTVSSTDASGNIAESPQNSFTTSAPSSISSIRVESKNLGEATITWKTSDETTSIVEYGLTTSYGEKKENSEYTEEHSISLSDLEQGFTYHYRIKGKDKNGNLYASADNTFEPKSPPKITGVNVNDVNEHGATITFETDVPADSNVSYAQVDDSDKIGSQGSREMTREHKVMLENLEQGTTYSIMISARDEQGTEATVEGPNFTTGKDENPPKIDQVRTDSALTQNDKVQTIISWKTDEQASTHIIYREGRTGQEKEIKVSDNLTTSHIAVVTAFKPGTVYNFRVKSIDSSGNEALSGHYTLLTPRKRENIIQIITSNFQEIFSWAVR